MRSSFTAARRSNTGSASWAMKKRLVYFFGGRDEEELSAALHAAFPALKVIDGQRWPDAQPPIAEGIHCCESRSVYLWPSDVVSELPSTPLPQPMRLAGKRFQGPATGPVIQFMRCNEKDGQLELGQLSAYIEDAKSPLGKAHAKVIAFLKKRYSCPLDCLSIPTGELLDSNVRGYLVGLSIQSEPESGPQLMLAFGRDTRMVPKR
jgi:hypothetical protein